MLFHRAAWVLHSCALSGSEEESRAVRPGRRGSGKGSVGWRVPSAVPPCRRLSPGTLRQLGWPRGPGRCCSGNPTSDCLLLTLPPPHPASSVTAHGSRAGPASAVVSLTAGCGFTLPNVLVKWRGSSRMPCVSACVGVPTGAPPPPCQCPVGAVLAPRVWWGGGRWGPGVQGPLHRQQLRPHPWAGWSARSWRLGPWPCSFSCGAGDEQVVRNFVLRLLELIFLVCED